MARPSKPKDEQNERFTLFSKKSSIYKLDYITNSTFLKSGEKIYRTDLVNQAIEEFITKWEKKNGSIPEKK